MSRIYVEYQDREDAEGKGVSEAIEDYDGNLHLLMRYSYERTGFDSAAGEEGIITITGIEFTDLYFYDYGNRTAEIPETISCKPAWSKEFISSPVTAIAPYASNHSPNDNYLWEVTLPKTLQTVGKAAFADCDMDCVTIPASVTEIGEYAFGYIRVLDKRGEDGAEIGFEKIDDFVISCYPSTAGEKYAKDNGFEYKLLTD